MKRRNDNKPKQRQKLKKWYYPKTTRTSKTIMQRRQHQDAEEPHQIKTTMTNKRHHLKKQLYTESTLLYITKRKYAFYCSKYSVRILLSLANFFIPSRVLCPSNDYYY